MRLTGYRQPGVLESRCRGVSECGSAGVLEYSHKCPKNLSRTKALLGRSGTATPRHHDSATPYIRDSYINGAPESRFQNHDSGAPGLPASFLLSRRVLSIQFMQNPLV